MTFCLFISARGTLAGDPTPLVAATPGLARALVHTPAAARDPYLDDGAPPDWVAQLYFPTVEALEAADAWLLGLVPLLEGAQVTQQAMVARRFPVPDAAFRTAPGAAHCTYLVAYEGVAEDPVAWLGHYIGHHPPIMARFPGIRQIEIYTRMDWVGSLPFPRVNHLQRNKVVFDSPAALDAALNSPVRHEMRADYHRFPPYTGPVTHFPMLTQEVAGATT